MRLDLQVVAIFFCYLTLWTHVDAAIKKRAMQRLSANLKQGTNAKWGHKTNSKEIFEKIDVEVVSKMDNSLCMPANIFPTELIPRKLHHLIIDKKLDTNEVLDDIPDELHELKIQKCILMKSMKNIFSGGQLIGLEGIYMENDDIFKGRSIYFGKITTPDTTTGKTTSPIPSKQALADKFCYFYNICYKTKHEEQYYGSPQCLVMKADSLKTCDKTSGEASSEASGEASGETSEPGTVGFAEILRELAGKNGIFGETNVNKVDEFEVSIMKGADADVQNTKIPKRVNMRLDQLKVVDYWKKPWFVASKVDKSLKEVMQNIKEDKFLDKCYESNGNKNIISSCESLEEGTKDELLFSRAWAQKVEPNIDTPCFGCSMLDSALISLSEGTKRLQITAGDDHNFLQQSASEESLSMAKNRVAKENVVFKKIKSFFSKIGHWIKNNPHGSIAIVTGIVILSFNLIALQLFLMAVFLFALNLVIKLLRVLFDITKTILKGVWKGTKSMANKAHDKLQGKQGKKPEYCTANSCNACLDSTDNFNKPCVWVFYKNLEKIGQCKITSDALNKNEKKFITNKISEKDECPVLPTKPELLVSRPELKRRHSI